MVSLVDSMVKYEYKETANVPEGVTPVSKDEVPSTVGKTDPEYITVNGKNLMGTGHSYVSLVNLSDAYEEALNAQGNAEIGSVYGGVASVTLSDAYHESFLSNGNAETANGLANVQKISVSD